jgi:DNA polymerase-3 subunit epsilon
VTRLAEQPVLCLDAQATAAHASGGALVEIGWGPGTAGTALTETGVAAHVVAPPPGTAMPRAVARLTGIRQDEWERGVLPGTVWPRLVADALALCPRPVPAVVHFVRFEEPFLRALHSRHGSGPFPFELLCTHAIARRLLPGLPRRTLRALAGYFGAGVAEPRRSTDHVVATAFVWRRLVEALEGEGIVELPALRAWLACAPPRRPPRSYPLPRERRLELPRGPGVYRLHRAGGGVVYVGKAVSLRERVSSHFHAPDGERALEMLSQVREVTCTETATALEAALLESDEIKRLSPPYNRALAVAGRAVWFATADLRDLRGSPDEQHTVGPLASAEPFDSLAALRGALAAEVPAPLLVRARAVGAAPAFAPGPEPFAAGLVRFAEAHGRLASALEVRRVGARLWASRRDAAPVEVEAGEREGPRSFSWDGETVRGALEETVLRAAHAVRRARWLLRLSECTLAWLGSGMPGRRLLCCAGGVVTAVGYLDPGEGLPLPPGAACAQDARRAAFDVATFDRLRVLTTELRRLAAGASSVEMRLGAHARLTGRRLEAVLRWV